jgi:hypothetical protein
MAQPTAVKAIFRVEFMALSSPWLVLRESTRRRSPCASGRLPGWGVEAVGDDELSVLQLDRQRRQRPAAAGPPVTAASWFGANLEKWQKHSRTLSASTQLFTSQPWWVQKAE